MIEIYSIIKGYKIYGVCGNYCIARSVTPRASDLFVIWKIHKNKSGVHSGRYFSHQMDAELEFERLTNMRINYSAETAE